MLLGKTVKVWILYSHSRAKDNHFAVKGGG